MRMPRREEVAEKLAVNGMDYLKIDGLRLGREEGEKSVREVLGEFNIDQVRSTSFVRFGEAVTGFGISLLM